MTTEGAPDTEGQFNLDVYADRFRCKLALDPDSPQKEITVNRHPYRLVDGDPIRERVRRRADEIRALMNEYMFEFSEAKKVAVP